MVDTVVQRLGRLDIAVNNAGLNKNAAAEDTPEADWDLTFALNTKGLFLCCQVCCAACPSLPRLPHMLNPRSINICVLRNCVMGRYL